VTPALDSPMTSLSVLVPVYNEQHLVATSLARLVVLETSPILERIQVVVVDDCSRDGTPEVLQRFQEEQRQRGGRIEWVFLRHERNGGKGKAIQTALARADCAITVIHDADLEYHPKDLVRIVQVFEEDRADAVFGSRFAGGERRRVLMYRHELGNRLLTFLTNLATNLNLTDMETCYKAVRTDLLKSIPIVSNDFRLEPELAIKLAKREARLFEVPISYSGRTYQEGKKINWRDGFKALWAILRFALSDSVYAADEYGSHILGRLSRAPRFNAWMADTVKPYCGRRILEIGSGTGNLTRRLVPRDRYVASDVNPLYLQTLQTLTADRPYLTAQYTDVAELASYPRDEKFDTVVCLNVIEHVEDDRGALENIRAMLSEDGRAIVLVPHGPWNLGTLDEVLGHKRRYTPESLRRVAALAGFQVKALLTFNRASSLPWYLNGKILRRRTFGLFQVKMVNWLTPLFRLIDGWLPFPPLSLIAVLEPRVSLEAGAASLDVSRERAAGA
jgi:glycosyltransferase involved in cell wall biosynthesis/phospholipid N-methyltransferase